jgi:glutamate dehydrogenase/leucine dehydrogenase
MRLMDLSTAEFASELAERGGRAWIVIGPDDQTPHASTTWLADLAETIGRDDRDFDRHEGVFLEVGSGTGALFGAFVHRTIRGQGAGGVRLWPYPRLESFLRDGLRLSVGMSRKSALAGLWWGGGKGVIARPLDGSWRDPDYRRTLYREYGRFITGLRGCYVAAEDVGTSPADMAELFRTTRFTTCIPPGVGGSGNPSRATARGVASAMEAALRFAGYDGIAGRRIVLQGAGNVAEFLIEQLLEANVGSVLATDISGERCEQLSEKHADDPVEVRPVDPDDSSIFAEPCDVFSPNALGGVLEPDTIAMLQAKIVCGGANNQLLDDRRDDALLAERGILYVPDFVANRMGIVNCANEQYGWLPEDSAIERHFDPGWEDSIFSVTHRILEHSRNEGVTTSQAAAALADEACAVPHPIWGHRGFQIIEGLIADRWEVRSGSISI